MKNTCVIGYPIKHSRSPLIHNYWMEKYSIKGQYSKQEILPDKLKNFFSNFTNQGYIGCNVTIPYKEKVLEFTVPTETVKILKAANTIYIKNGNLYSTNTDTDGFINSLKQDAPNIELNNRSALVIGAGGAARAIIYSLLQENIQEIEVTNRTIDRTLLLKKDFGPKIKPINWNDKNSAVKDKAIIINTTSLGMMGQPKLEISLDKVYQTTTIADIVYTPLKTELIKTAEKNGLSTSTGLGMLLHQAVGGFQLWYGVKPVVTKELRAIIEKDLLEK